MSMIKFAVFSSILFCAPLLAAENVWDRFVVYAEARHGDAGAKAARFLAENRPARDDNIDLQILRDNLDYALRARSEFPWARKISGEMFHNDVLPYASLDETRGNWRPELYAVAKDVVADCRTATEAAQALNRELFNKVNVHYNTGRKKPNQSPAESIAQHRATCSGLAILLVDACRAVGVPARIAGVANWNNKDGNHTWVEVWDNGWHFTGADEFDAAGLDRAWFVDDAGKAIKSDPLHAVWASSWKKTGNHFRLAWNMNDSSVPGVNVTTRYTQTNAAPAATSGSNADLAEHGADGEVIRYLRAWDSKGGQRVAVRVMCVDSAGEVVAEAQTRAGQADLNDMAKLALHVGQAYKLTLLHDHLQYQRFLSPSAAASDTLDLYLDQLSLTRESAEAMVHLRAAEARFNKLSGCQKTLREAVIKHGEFEMKLLERKFGDAPFGQRSLWISMHGGGGAPPEVNDQQWHNQIKLYQPAEGYYVAPRAPTDAWNLWHQKHIDPMFDELIACYVIAHGVDPNRVYLMGYSAGGDGVYQVAPRMADRFAAASMMAGHPNEAKPLGLRDLPFAIFVGGKDSAYQRNEVAVEWAHKLDDLQKADPSGYSHRLTVYPECGHWMNKQDAEALPWMADQTRDPWPRRVVWYQDDVTHTRFYWLAVKPEDAVKDRTIIAEVDGQTISITSTETKTVTLRLRDRLVDLDRPIRVMFNGKLCFEGRVTRKENIISESLAERADIDTACTAELKVRRPEEP